MLQLRPYQREAIDAVYQHLRSHDDNPCAVVPTAGGKTPIIANICKDAVGQWKGRVLVLAHVKELLEQAADKLRTVCPEIPFGVYSAGLKRRDQREPVIVAGIQSIWKKACEFDPFDLVIVDEAHLIPPDGDGMYRQFLADAKTVNPHLRVIGFTATPYRLKSGTICTPEGFLNQVCYEVGVRELIVQGYLCPLISKAGQAKADISTLHVRGGEFIAGEVEDLMDDDALVEAACEEIVEQTKDRNAVLIFASGVKHGEHIVRVLAENHGIECGFVTGDTPTEERDRTLTRFRNPDWVRQLQIDFGDTAAKPLKYLCNVNVLTTGFDAPHIDCVALVRPTLSPGLYYQMVGRGFRLHASKQNCLVLDFGGNVLRHGPVDQIRVKERNPGTGAAPAKECPECNSLIAAGYAVCPSCGYEFPPPDRNKHDAKASNAGVLSGQVTIETFAVQDVAYSIHTKRGASEDDPKTLRVDYKIGWHKWKSEWVCFGHTGYARGKAVAWWKQRSREPVPATAEEAYFLLNEGIGIAEPKSITVRSVSGEDYDRITGYQLESIPEFATASDEEVPF
ncbi:MAG: DEAD/DEAH box helicase [Bacteroidales bacterium]|nr:DEAD/DEAH box helicase [Bacteroidales bacterium]